MGNILISLFKSRFYLSVIFSSDASFMGAVVTIYLQRYSLHVLHRRVNNEKVVISL